MSMLATYGLSGCSVWAVDARFVPNVVGLHTQIPRLLYHHASMILSSFLSRYVAKGVHATFAASPPGGVLYTKFSFSPRGISKSPSGGAGPGEWRCCDVGGTPRCNVPILLIKRQGGGPRAVGIENILFSAPSVSFYWCLVSRFDLTACLFEDFGGFGLGGWVSRSLWVCMVLCFLLVGFRKLIQEN